MNSGNVVLPDLSGSVYPADNDAGMELLDNLLVDSNLQTTNQNLEMMKRLMKTRFSDESLIFLLHKIQEIQLGPTFQQFWHFIHNHEGIKYLKKSIAEITGENMNLRIEKESDKRCLIALFKIIEQLTTEKTQLVNQNGQLTAEKDQLATEKDQLVNQNGQLGTQNGQLATQIGQLANQNGQLATQNGQLITEKDQLATQYGLVATEKDQLATQYGQLATEKDQLATQYGQLGTQYGQLATEKDQVTTQNAQLTTQNGQLTTEKDQLAIQIEQMANEIAKLKAEKTKKNGTIGNLIAGMKEMFFRWKIHITTYFEG